MLKKILSFIGFAMLLSFVQGCGVKGRPMPPLAEPHISTGNLEDDLQIKQNNKKKNLDQKTKEIQINEP